MRFGPVPLLLVLNGTWRLDGAGIHNWGFLVYYALSLVHLVIVHYIVCFQMPVPHGPREIVGGLSRQQIRLAQGIHIALGSAGVSAIVTLLIYFLSPYDTSAPAHASVFAAVLALVYGVVLYARSGQESPADSP